MNALVPTLLAVLALFDAMLAGFRAAAGRDGRLEKAAYFRSALARGVALGFAIVTIHGVLAAILVTTSPAPVATWASFVEAGTIAAWILGAFATLTLLALLFWLSPIVEHQLLASILVLGPFTLARSAVILGGLATACIVAHEPRVWIVAASAAACMLSIERVLGRAYTARWQRLRQSLGSDAPNAASASQ